MTLLNNFQFSQSSLQDYVDCQRRFQLRYLQQRAWPAVEAEPAMDNELFLQRGSQFHHMAHQYWLGVPAQNIADQVEGDEVLSRWWGNFTDPDLGGFAQHSENGEERNLPGLIHPEISLSAPIGDHRIMAQYDLLIINTLRVSEENLENKDAPKDPKGFRATIYDWKTSTRLPKREWLIQRLQTRVYPYLLARAGAQFNGGTPIPPEQIEMIYWYSDFPDLPARFPYSQGQFEEDGAYLTGLIEEISNVGEKDAPLTDEERRCQFCVYRSLCNRGVEAGSLAELEGDGEAEEGFVLDLDFEHIAEIEY
ncbi:MAG: PD-(D/E)XK nuclease family protein [Chloroflexi bacterium]|nr:PD-(D/E)XK nuclease family protein [Chloroflexota bacterium]